MFRTTTFIAFMVAAQPILMPLASAQAATATSSVLVTATVLSFCTIAAAPLPFGNYSAPALAVNTSIVVACTASTGYNVGLSAGAAVGATVTTRQMTGATGTTPLSYALFRDAGFTLNWGATNGTNTVAGTGTGLSQTLTVYGQVAANQLVTPGLYTDTVVATITY